MLVFRFTVLTMLPNPEVFDGLKVACPVICTSEIVSVARRVS